MMIVVFSIQLAIVHQGPQTVRTFCSLVDAIVILVARIGMQSIVLLYSYKCAKFH